MKDIHLYTAPTSNGWKPIIFLEEADIEYDITAISFDKREQKENESLARRRRGELLELLHELLLLRLRRRELRVRLPRGPEDWVQTRGREQSIPGWELLLALIVFDPPNPPSSIKKLF